MPKKTTTARSGAQYQRQKGFELVRPEIAEGERVVPEQIATAPKKAKKISAQPVSAAVATEPTTEAASTRTEGIGSVPTPTGASASARMAARRQANLKAQQQRSGSALITAEHFAYVRRDLMTIAILATIMVIAIIVLYFFLV